MSGVAAEDTVAAELSPSWVPTGSLVTPRLRHKTTLLPNGKVLVGGSDDRSHSLSSVELYDPPSGTWTGPNGGYVRR